MIVVETPFGRPLTWRESVLITHKRWEARPPPLFAAAKLPSAPAKLVNPKPLVPPPPPLIPVQEPGDALGAVDLQNERAKRLTKASSSPVIKRLNEPPRRYPQEFHGFWSGLHAGKDAQSGLGAGMMPTAAAARGEDFADYHSGLHAGRDTESGLGPGLVPRPRRARGEEFANWYSSLHAGKDTRSQLGAALIPAGEVHKSHEAPTFRGAQYTQYSRPKGGAPA